MGSMGGRLMSLMMPSPPGVPSFLLLLFPSGPVSENPLQHLVPLTKSCPALVTGTVFERANLHVACDG